jgi:hypothetical protein
MFFQSVLTSSFAAIPVDTETQTVTFLDAQNTMLHHPAMRGVKTVNLGKDSH